MLIICFNLLTGCSSRREGGLHWLGAQFFQPQMVDLFQLCSHFTVKKQGECRDFCKTITLTESDCCRVSPRLKRPLLLAGEQVLIHCLKQTLVYLLLHVNITAIKDTIQPPPPPPLLDRCWTDVICYSFKCCSKSECIGTSDNWIS